MPIEDLHGEDGTPLVIGAHPRIAVVDVHAGGRHEVRRALEAREATVVVGAEDLRQRLRQAQQRLDEAHDAVVARQQSRCDSAAEQARLAATDASRAIAMLQAVLAGLNEFEALGTQLLHAQAARDAATHREAVEAKRLADVLARRSRLSEQRRNAAAAIDELRAAHPDRRSKEFRQQVAGIETTLARAEAEQAEAEQRAEIAAGRARAERVRAVEALEAADQRLRDAVPAATAAAWTPGPPLPACLEDHKIRLAATLADADARAVAAREEEDAAALAAQQEHQALQHCIDQRELLDPVAVVTSWLSVGDALDSGTESLVLDDPFADLDGSQVGGVLEELVGHCGVQVFYLTADPNVLSWAIELPHHLGGICGVARSARPDGATAAEPRQPALVD